MKRNKTRGHPNHKEFDKATFSSSSRPEYHHPQQIISQSVGIVQGWGIFPEIVHKIHASATLVKDGGT